MKKTYSLRWLWMVIALIVAINYLIIGSYVHFLIYLVEAILLCPFVTKETVTTWKKVLLFLAPFIFLVLYAFYSVHNEDQQKKAQIQKTYNLMVRTGLSFEEANIALSEMTEEELKENMVIWEDNKKKAYQEKQQIWEEEKEIKEAEKKIEEAENLKREIEEKKQEIVSIEKFLKNYSDERELIDTYMEAYIAAVNDLQTFTDEEIKTIQSKSGTFINGDELEYRWITILSSTDPFESLTFLFSISYNKDVKARIEEAFYYFDEGQKIVADIIHNYEWEDDIIPRKEVKKKISEMEEYNAMGMEHLKEADQMVKLIKKDLKQLKTEVKKK